MKSIILVLITLFIFPLYANEPVSAIVILLKGSVFYDRSGVTEKSHLKIGDTLLENDKVTTTNASLVKLKLSDGSMISISPNSTLVIEKLAKKNPSFVRLLSGSLRAEVTKDPNRNYGLFVKTATAALGVRGTDFKVIFNDKNRITSAMTFSGEVALVNSKSTKYLDSPDEVESYDEHYVSVLAEQFEHEKTKRVLPGEFSGAYPGYSEPTVPVLLAKKQFDALKNSNALASSPHDEVNYRQSAPSETKPSNDVLVPRPRSEYSKESYPTSVVPVPGGYLDQETGFYVAPPEDAKFNEAEKRYEIPAEYGEIDKATGDYIPPFGLKLDPIKGFVFIGDQIGKLSSATLAFAEKMNGTFRSSVSKIKELTRVDAVLLPAFYYDSNVVSDFYGRLDTVTNKSSYVLGFDGFLGRKVFDSKNWLVYPKGMMKSKYHYNQEEKSVNQEDYFDWIGAIEINHRYLISHRKGRQIFEVGRRAVYKDLQGADQYRFFIEDTYAIWGQEFKLHDKQTTKIYGKYTVYDTYQDKRGEIWSGHFLHTIDMGRRNDLVVGYNLAREFPKSSYEVMTSEGMIAHVRKNIFDYYQLRTSARLKYSDFRKHLPRRGEEMTFSPEVRFSKVIDEYFNMSLFYNYQKNYSDLKDPYQFDRSEIGGDLKFLF